MSSSIFSLICQRRLLGSNEESSYFVETDNGTDELERCRGKKKFLRLLSAVYDVKSLLEVEEIHKSKRGCFVSWSNTASRIVADTNGTACRLIVTLPFSQTQRLPIFRYSATLIKIYNLSQLLFRSFYWLSVIFINGLFSYCVRTHFNILHHSVFTRIIMPSYIKSHTA